MPKLTKIQTRAKILSIIENAKRENEKGVLDINLFLSSFEEIEDYKTLSNIIINEIKADKSAFDYILSLVLTKILNKKAEEYIFASIMSDKITDLKKIFLINILQDINKDADYMTLLKSVEEPELLYKEDEFLNEHKFFNPSKHIDFLDFYLKSKSSEKEELIDTIFENNNNESAIILAYLIYLKDEMTEYIIDKISNIRSYFSYLPLQFILQNFKEKKIIAKAKSAVNKLKLSGLRKEIKKENLFKELLKNSKPVNSWVSYIDGSYNFALMFLREKDDNCYMFFSMVINLKAGIIECIGFDDLERGEFKNVAQDIFEKDKAVKIDIKIARNIIENAIKNNIKENIKIPYEALPWINTTYDIEKYCEDKFIKIVEENLEETEIDDKSFKNLIDEPFFDYCYLEENNNDKFDKILKDIILNTKNADEIIKQKVFNETFDTYLIYQAYFLYLNNKKEIANILYSIRKNEKYKKKLEDIIIKKSILIYFEKNADNIFLKEGKIKTEILKELKEKWKKEL